ncbi:MAG TPA: hypothetical protein VGO35_01980 [Gammaproteobacteria bacterium]|nr:hypothetical protein [Gammaproteobacteria bacterium]
MPMLLDVSEPDEKDLIANRTEAPDGNTLFEINITGIIGGKNAPLTVYFTGYTDGIECTAFGQGTVGFLGFSNSGNPIIKTSIGPLEILDKKLLVGCKNCIERLDKNKEITAKYPTPSWDLMLTGNKETDFSIGTDGKEYMRHGAKCLWLPQNDLIHEVSPAMCASMSPVKAQIRIKTGSCS